MVEAARRELLHSRARYVLRNDVVESVIMANPVMQAVHNGTRASPIERSAITYLWPSPQFTGCIDGFFSSGGVR